MTSKSFVVTPPSSISTFWCFGILIVREGKCEGEDARLVFQCRMAETALLSLFSWQGLPLCTSLEQELQTSLLLFSGDRVGPCSLLKSQGEWSRRHTPVGLGIWEGRGPGRQKASEVVRSEMLSGAGLCKQCCCARPYGAW